MENKIKSITYKKKFWDELKEDMEANSFATLIRLRSHYLGYLHGLMITGKITEGEQSKMENRLIDKVACEIEKREEKGKMNNRDLVLLTVINLKIAEHRKLKKEIIEAPPGKGMEVSKEELKELQKAIIKDIEKLEKRLSKKEKEGKRQPLIVWPSSIFKEVL